MAHAFNSALPGWLVIVAQRHIESMHETTELEAASLGPLVRDASRALCAVVGCAKTYVAMFAEAPGFAHLHVHVVPRDASMPEEFRGPRMFGYLQGPPEDWVSLERRRELALSLRAAL